MQRNYDRDWFSDAPILICACEIPDTGWARADGRLYLDIDVAIAMAHISQTAADLGLGTCWVASYNMDSARAVLGIPPFIEPTIILPGGYPAGSQGEKECKSLGDLVPYNSWEGDQH